MQHASGSTQPTPGPEALRIRDELCALWGSDAAEARGVIHVCSAARDSRAALRVLRIHPGSPASARDRLALGAARARADWILSTGRILRAEPELTHALHPEPALAFALERWRHDCVGRSRPPRSAVLTRGANLDPKHPLFAAPEPALLLLPAGAAQRLTPALRARCEVAELAAPEVRAALDVLLARAANPRAEDVTILIEAGPETAAALYEPPCRVDELLLSLFEGPLERDALAGELPNQDRLAALLGAPRGSSRACEASGAWKFLRYRRDAEAAQSS